MEIVKPYQVASFWPEYENFVTMNMGAEDTIVSPLYGAWGEFLNLQNLVEIGGSLYRIRDDKTVIILDGDIDKLDDADNLEESDTTEGIYINWRACACDRTGATWKYEKSVVEEYNNRDYRVRSNQVWSNMTTWQYLGNNKVRIMPHFIHETKVDIRKRSIVGWGCERMHFNFDRQVWVSHNLQLPNDANYVNASLWYESTGWPNHYECNMTYTKDYRYPTYTTDRTWDMQAGYCLAVKIFAQHVYVTDQPSIENGWYFYPYPYMNFSGFYSDPLGNCWNFAWMYGL